MKTHTAVPRALWKNNTRITKHIGKKARNCQHGDRGHLDTARGKTGATRQGKFVHLSKRLVLLCLARAVNHVKGGGTLKGLCVSILCLCEESCKGGTEVSVKIPFAESKRLSGKALMWPLWKR